MNLSEIAIVFLFFIQFFLLVLPIFTVWHLFVDLGLYLLTSYLGVNADAIFGFSASRRIRKGIIFLRQSIFYVFGGVFSARSWHFFGHLSLCNSVWLHDSCSTCVKTFISALQNVGSHLRPQFGRAGDPFSLLNSDFIGFRLKMATFLSPPILEVMLSDTLTGGLIFEFSTSKHIG